MGGYFTTSVGMVPAGVQAPTETDDLAETVISGPNRAPVWLSIPNITFIEGIASWFSIGGYVSDPDGDAMVISHLSGAFPNLGISFNATLLRFEYDGTSGQGTATDIRLLADDLTN